jgi:inner membrane protein
MDFFSEPQWWLIVGLLFLIAEVFSASFFFAFLSVGALATALLAWIGLTPGMSGQLLAFSVVTITTLIVGRQPLRRWMSSRTRKQEYTEYVGDKATVIKTIPALGEGRIAYRGTEWIAATDTNLSIMAGKQVVIKRMDGIRAVVEAIGVENFT